MSVATDCSIEKSPGRICVPSQYTMREILRIEKCLDENKRENWVLELGAYETMYEVMTDEMMMADIRLI